MLGISNSKFLICTRCLRAANRPSSLWIGAKPVRYASNGSTNSPPEVDRNGIQPESVEKPTGAMTQRLQQLSEQSLETGGRSAVKAVEEAGFSENLKSKLEKKIANASFRSEHASAFAQINLPAGAGKDTRDIAGAKPWAGVESVEDSSLRMLNDGHKPLSTKSRTPSVRGPSHSDTGRPKSKPSAGVRLAGAREGASVYTMTRDQEQALTDEEREKFRQQMKARFQPGARQVAATISGLQSLANQRIEDAIARGQFKNLSDRGKKIERDHNANNPFIDTTEYFMNKMIKKQEIVPPWIEKQQEVISTANVFRSRLRSDWKRHVSRVIASRGGDLASQIQTAEEYALAELVHNPNKKQLEQMNTVGDNGQVSQITITGELKPSSNSDSSTVEEKIVILDQTLNDGGTPDPAEELVQVSEQPPPTSTPSPDASRRVSMPPFRDVQWENTERSYHNLAIQNLNSLTRSYNLMAPDLAKKPYFSLERELQSCFADVAPQIAASVRERALTPKIRGVEVIGHKPGGVLERFSFDKVRHVHDDPKPLYGFREMWRDLFSSKS